MFARLVGLVMALVIGLAAGAGWQQSSHEARNAAVDSALPTAAARATAAAMPRIAAPSLVLEEDGRLTGHFDSVTPRWLLAALERAGVLPMRGSPALALHPGALNGPDASTPAVRDEALQRLRIGDDPERLAALTELVHHDVAIPQRDLVDTFQSSASDELALFAFTIHVESVAEDSEAAREAIARGMESTNGAVRADAARRMIELERLVQVHAGIAAQGLQ